MSCLFATPSYLPWSARSRNRCSTGENFNGILNDLAVEEPFCDPVYAKNCGYHPAVAALYMVSFVLFTTLTMLKLMVAIILDNFGDAVHMDAEKEVRLGWRGGSRAHV